MAPALPAPGWTVRVCLLAASLFPGLQAQTVLVNDTVSGFIGTDVVLHCSFTNPLPNVKITQVTWQKATNGSKQNVAIYNPAMGVSILSPYKGRVKFLNPSFQDGTIQLFRLQLDDEGVYICEFATFPTGNRESQLNLTVLAKPNNWMEGTTRPLIARVGMTEKILVATCTSSNGKPPSSVTWDTTLKGAAEFQEIRNTNGTVTVISRYRLVPSREAHRQQLMCIVNYQLDRFTDSITLNVQYEPEVTIEGFDGNWFLNRKDVKLTCKSDANPPATSYQWKLLNGSLPENVEIQNNTLFFKGPVSHSLAGTYICEATNTIGTRSGLVEVNVTEFPSTPPPSNDRKSVAQPSLPTAVIGGVVGGVSLVLAVAVVLFVLLRRRRHTFKGDYSTKKHVYGNGYSKAGIPQHHPPMAQNLQYPDDSDDEKKPGPLGGSSYDDEDEDAGGGERKAGGANKYEDDSKRPYFTVDEGEPHTEPYDERTLGFQYDPEQLDIAENMVSQNDGSFISKKEWYV
ncbi:nectin-1 isoform X2 [Alligator mississippiensis]|uniref:nectin-1 isoform X2 n=1 Tax=Alligator mississippiensis TaxID=8496 RepID=UPI0003D0BD60|nr:nectin-1 isoform X2 [Alligator mississippiensis]